MSLSNIELQAIQKDGSVQTIALTNLTPIQVASQQADLPLSLKAEEGAQYRLIDLSSGNHLKGQRLLRHQKNLRVFIEDSQALELQDYFVASLIPVENAPIYRLENQSCNEVQVISNYPAETFEAQESNVWTESDSALDCKVALLNPGSVAALMPTSSVVAAGLGISEISAAVIGIPLLLSGNDSGNTPTQPPTPPPPPPPVDTTTPTVTISSDVASLKAGETAIITFTFSEDIGSSFSWNGTSGNLTISGGTLSEISGSGLTRTAVFTPTTNASGQTAKITVNDQSYQDIAGNKGAGSSSPDLAIDTHLPNIRSVQISHDLGGINQHLNEADQLFVSVTFDEPINVQLAHGDPTLALIIGNQRVLASYASGSGTATLMFKTTIVADQTDVDGVAIANNGLALNGSVMVSRSGNPASLAFDNSSLQPVFVVDTSAPNLLISSNRLSLKANETALITLTFSEVIDNSQVQAFDIKNLIVSGGTLSDLSGNGLVRTAVFTPTDLLQDGVGRIAVVPGSFQDLAGNPGLASAPLIFSTDTLTPKVTITSDTSTLKSGETALITFAFSENPGTSFSWNGEAGDLVVSGGTLSAISGTGLTRTGIFTPAPNMASGAASITVTAASYEDSAGNTGSAGTSPSITFDTLSPSVTISSDVTTLKSGETANITFTFTEDPGSSFTWNGTTGDLLVAGGTLSSISGSGLTRSAVFTPTANLASISATITVANSSYIDSAGNPGSSGTTPSINIDTFAPTVSISSNVTSLKAGETANITFTFSEDPGSTFAWNGSTGDIAVTGGTLGAISGTDFTRSAVYTPTANSASGNASITLASSTYQDAAGNNGAAGSTPAISIDTLAPTVTITSDVSKLKSGETANIAFTFSEDPGNTFAWGGSAGDITVTGGTLGAISGTDLSRTAVFTPSANLASGTASITVAANSYQDAAGNNGAAGTSPSISIDTLAPTVRVASNVSTLKAGETANITFTFSEDPGGSFVWDGSTGDVLVTGGTLGAISGTGLTRTAVFTPTSNLANGNASITVAANAYQDSASNPGAAGTTPAISIDTLAPSVAIASNKSALKIGETATITFTFTEEPGSSFNWNGSDGDVVVAGGTLGAISGSGLSRTATFTPSNNLANGNASITVTANSYQDAPGNNGNAGITPSISIDTLASTVISVILSGATGDQNQRLNAGDTLRATLTFNDVVTLNTTGGSPTLALLIGSSTVQATYVSGSGSNALVFTTTIINGQTDTDGVAIALNPLSLNAATLQDNSNNSTVNGTAAVLSNSNYLVDTTAPTVTVASNVSALTAGETATITFTFSEDPSTSFAWDGSAGDVLVSGGTLSAISGTGTTRTAVFTPTANLASGPGTVTVTANSYQDPAGNNGSSGISSNITLDTLAPSISSLALSSATGAVASPLDASVKLLNATDTLSATVTFSEAVTLNTTVGSPTLALVIGSSTVQATYVSGSSTTALVFSTTIASGQTDTDGVAIALNALSLNGATLNDSAGNTSAITSIAVANNPLYLVDTTAPSIIITSDVATLKSGETANITFTFSEDPGSSFVWVSNAGDVVVSGGTLGNISGTGLTRTATFTPTANVLSGTASLSVNAGKYTDAAGNTGSAGSTPLLTFSTSSPTISQVGLSSATGAVSNLLNAGDVIVASVVFSEIVVLDSTAGSPTLGLTIGNTLVQAAYVSGSGITEFMFSYTILAGQDDANGIAIPSAALTLNGSTLKSVSGNNVTLGNAAVADNILYLVDTTAPNVLITSNANTLKAGETATITFTFSEDPGTSFSWNGSAGDVVVAGGTLGAISGTGLTRTATFTPTANLASGNASITVAGNSYQDTAGNLGSSGLSPIISIDTLAPAVTSVALSSATGAVNQRLNAGDTLSATLTFNDTVTLNTAGGSPNLALLVGSSTVQATYVSGSGTNALVFSITIISGQTDTDGVAFAINALSLNGATLKDGAGNNSVITATAVSSNSNYLVDTTAPTVAVTSNLSSLKAGDTATITFTFSEDPGASFAWDGTSGDVVITGGSLGAISGTGLTRTATFTPTSNLASSSASIAVTSNSYQDAADNNGSAGSLTTLTVDTLAPSVSSLVLTSATGSVASPGDATVKLLNATDTLSATVTFTEAVTLVTTAGSPTLALVIGSSTVQATYVSGSGTNALVFTTTLVSGQTDTDGVAISLNALTLNGATLKDTAGNSSVISSIAVADNSKYLVDTTSPTLNITSDVATLKAGETAVISFTFSEDPGSSFVWSANAGDVTVSGGTLGNISGTGLLRTATFTPNSNVLAGTASITVNAGTYTDPAGNTGGAGTTPVVTFSTTTPTVSQVGISSATGALNNLLNAGDVVYAKVVFSEAIVLNSTGGSPTLGLTIGSTLVQAAYVSGSGSTDFVFGYTILAGQDDANGIAIPSAALTLNGSTLKSVPGNSVALGNASVADNFLYPVDTTALSLVITSSAASLKSGETSLICFTFSEDPDTSFSLADVTVTGGTLSALTGLGTVRRSTFTPTPNLASGTASITVADLSYTDAAGNLGAAGITPSISIDTLAPSISHVALSGSTGKVNNTLNAGDTLSVTATFNDTVILNTDGGVPTFKLTIGVSTVYAAYVSGSGTNAFVFTTTIVSGQTDTDGVAIPANALLLNGATLKDANGNTSSIGLLAVTSNAAFMVDTTGPTVAITSDISSLTVGATANITFTFSEDPDTSFAWDGTLGDVVVAGGTLSAISGTGLTRTAVFTPTTNQGSGTASITVTGNSYQDTAGNNGAAGTTPTLNLDTLAPSITSLALTSSTGGLVSASDATVNNLNAGDTLSATVTFNDVITVNTSGGTPYLTLNVGGTSVQAAYVSGSGSNALVFTATVASGQNDSNGVAIGADALNLNGGTLKDASDNNITLTSVAVTDNGHYLVDTTRPTVAVSSSTSALISGQTATITFSFSEDPGSSFVWNGTSGDLTVMGGTLSALSTTANPLTRTAVLTPTSGVSAGTANVAIALNSYTDAAGNIGQEASAGVTDKTADISVNTTTTTVASVALLSATGIQNNFLNQGDVVSVVVNFTEAVFLNANVGTPSLDLTIGSTVVSAQYASGAGTAQLVFNYTILNAQTDVNGIAINANSLSLNGKVLTDTAGNTPTLTFTAVGDNANYLVDTTAPTLVSIASSKSVFLSGETSVITFTFSEDPGSTFTWNGSAGDITLVNGTLSALTGTGLTRSATFLPTQGLSGGNATITVSNNLYTDLAGNLGSGNTLDGLLLNTTPATLMDVQISSATGVQNNALNAGDVVTVTAHFSEAQTLNTTSGSPTVALQIGSSTVNATYASGAGTANLLFTYTIQAGQTDANGIAIGANALSLNGSTLQDPRANTTTLLAPGTADNSNYTVDTTAPFLSITSNVGQLGAGETANITFTFSEDPGTTFVWNGSTGDVTLSNGTLSAISGTGTTRTAVFTPSPSMNAGTASISVSAGTYQDTAGNDGSAGGTPSLTFDTLAPTISSIALSSSTGILNSYLNEGDTANVSVTFSEAVSLNLTAGSPTLALLVGSNTVQATYVSGSGTNALVFTTTIAAGQTDTDGIAIAINALSLNGAVLSDLAGNGASTNSVAVASNAAYMVDTLAPSVSLAFNVATLKAGETATLTLTANDKTGTSFTWNGTAGDLTVSGGTLSAIGPFVLSGANYVSTATFTPTAGSTTAGLVSTASAVYTDLAGNPGQVGSSASVSIDTSVPTLTSMNITGTSGILSNTLNAGDVVQITATFSEAVIVNNSGGSPKVSLNVGGSADSAVYVSGSGTTDLLFNYTVVAGQNDANGLSYAANALVLNGGTIKDSAGNSAVITAIARADNAAYKVDTTAPTVAITSSRTQLLVGQTANITFTFSEDPGSSFVWDGSAGDITLSNGTLSAISGTGLTRTAIFTPTANFNSGNASIVVTAASYTDAAGNTGVIGTTPSITVDTLGIDITQIDYYTDTMTSIAGAKIGVWIQYPETAYFNTTGGLPTIDLIIGNTVVKATYSTNYMSWPGYYFLYTVLDGQNDTNGISYVANSLSLNGATIKDGSGNNAGLLHSGGNNGGVVVDTTHPTIEITSNKTTLKIGETATITFTANEAIRSIGNLLTPSNFTLTGGTLSNLIVASSQVATATFTPNNNQQQVNSSIILKAGAIQDYAYNISLVTNAAPVMLIDTVAPAVSITMSRNIVSSVNTSLVTFTFSEDPGISFNWDGSVGDITITNGTLGAISGTGLTRTATLTAPVNTTLWNTTLSVVANSYTDAIGNLGSAATSPLFSIDSTTPKTNSRSIGSQGQLNSRVNEGDVVELTLFMDKTNMVLDTSGGFPTMAFTIGNTLVQASYFSHTTSTILFKYTILAGQTDTDGVTLNANGVSYNGSIYKDTYGNMASIVYPAWTVGSVLVDTTAPTLTITSSRNAILAGQTATITFTFSEDIGTSFLIGDIVATNGVLSSFTGTGAVWTATLTPTANFAGGTSSITVAANTYIDLAGNNGSAGITPVINVDTIVPTVAVTTTKTTFKAGDTATITFTFSEDPGTSFVWNGTSGDIIFSGGTLGAISGSGLTRTALFTPTANSSGNPIISVRSESYQDALGNLGTSGSVPFMMYDTAAPTVTAAADSITLKAGQTTRVYFTFNEDPGTSFSWNGSVGDLLITGAGTLVPDTVPSHQIYAMRGFDFTPPANVNSGSTTITVLANSYQDTVGNLGSASNTITISYDTLAPTVSITSSTALVGMGQTATITFTFSEDPGSTFTWNGTTGDVVVTQGTLGAISGTGLTRTAVFTPFADTPLTAASITVTAGSYTDTATNAGQAGTSPTLNVNTFKNAIYLDDIANNIGGYAIESPNTTAKFGFAVSLAGDFNGDGYGDVVMGAPLNTFTDLGGTVRTEGGGVVLYEGGQNTSLVPKGYSGTGQVNGHYYTYSVTKGWLGFSVAGMGDMNNDGLADLLIGMPQDGLSSNPGGAFLVYGKANSSSGSLAEYQYDISTLSTTPAALSITSTFDTAGFSVSSAGDVNGDGWTDMIISAHFQVVGSLVGNTGKSYVVYGGAALSSLQTISLGDVGGSVHGFVISGWQAGEESGTSVSSAGDINDDGLADLLVSAYYNDVAGTESGMTYVVLGKTGDTAVNLSSIKNNIGGFAIKGENAQDKSGVSVSSGGDINGDGIGDIIIGAIIAGTGNSYPASGRTYVVFGRTTANATIDLGQIASGVGGFAILSNITNEQSGHSVSSAGDINGDGLADIILGAPYSPIDGGANTGRSFVVYGKATTTNVNLSDVYNNLGGFAIVGQGAQDLSGYSVGAAGDINGDGLADLIVGAPGYDPAASSTSSGRSYIIFGSKTGAFAAGSAVDNVGTSANDTLTSTGGQTLAGGSFSAGTGNDTFIASGADVLLGGMGKDIFTVNTSMITALQNNFGAGGNTSQLAKIDGGAGIDTIRMGGTGGLGFDFSLVSNTSVGNIEGASRINSVERIDLRTDTASNQITLRVADVLDMAGSNWANLNTLNTLGAGGWQNVGTGTSFSASGVKYHQVAIDGTSVDRVNTSGWTLQTTGTVKDANAVVYDVYLAASNAPAMMLVQQDIIRFSVP